jgi:hypothetical protein
VKKVLVLLGIFGLTALYFSDVLTGQRLLVERDLTTFFYPFRFIWTETVRQGQFPFWNPYIKCGVPLFATVQPAVAYPLSLPHLFLPLDVVFNWTIIGHFFLAAAFTYGLMRELGASTQGSLAGALAFLLSGYLISVHNVLNTLLSASWYPLVILCGCRLVRGGGLRWAVACGTCLCCMFLAGGLEIVLFALASLLCLCLYPTILPLSPEQRHQGLPHRLGLLSAALLVFLGLSMVQLLPFLELYRLSDRFGGVPLEQATSWSLAPKDVVYFLLPDLYGQRTSPDLYWKEQNYLKSIYMGPVVFGLAAVYFLRRGKGGLPLLLAMGLTLALALGGRTPLYPLFHRYVPLFATVRYPVKFLFLFIFFLCLTAGLGLDRLRRRFAEKRPLAVRTELSLAALTLLLAGLLLAGLFLPGKVGTLVQHWGGSSLEAAFVPTVLHNLNRLLVVAILAVMVVYFALRGRLVRCGCPLLLVLLTLDLFLGNRGFATKLDSGQFHAETELVRTLKAETELFRFHVLPAVRQLPVSVGSYEEFHRVRQEFLGNDLMMEHHLADIDGYNVPLQPRYGRLINLVRGQPLAPIRPLLDLLNVKYVLARDPVALPGYEQVRDGLAGTRLYRNRNCLPRALLVPDFRVLDSEEEVIRVLRDADFDPRHTVLLEDVPKRLLALRREPVQPRLRREVAVLSYEHNRMVLEASTPEAALLVTSEAYYPGWEAYVDGEEEEILLANQAFRAVPLGPGRHRVEMVCRPTSFRIGLLVTLVTAVSVGTALVLRPRGRNGLPGAGS